MIWILHRYKLIQFGLVSDFKYDHKILDLLPHQVSHATVENILLVVFSIIQGAIPIWHICNDKSCRNVPIITFTMSACLPHFENQQMCSCEIWCCRVVVKSFWDFLWLFPFPCSVFRMHTVSVSVLRPFRSNIYLLTFTCWNSLNPATMLKNVIFALFVSHTYC